MTTTNMEGGALSPEEKGVVGDLDFTESLQKILVPGVGSMTVQEAEKEIEPCLIEDSYIVFDDTYTFAKLKEHREYMTKYAGLFSPEQKVKYTKHAAAIERKLYIRAALEEFRANKDKAYTVH